MQLFASSPNPMELQQFADDLEQILADAGLSDSLRIARQSASGTELAKGVDPVTLTTIILTAVGAGGALTIAVGKEGFLTRLAKVLEAWVTRKMDITLDTDQGKVHLSGSAGHIERLLREKLGKKK